ncbi:MAG: carboxylating nicotinate-nucleotide diphosphorylase [Bdellovibrionales bacterium]|nr:carboxylating nicotinate-nucleotide diphosphorylase [Bdellovibrionales bacterium]
MQELFSSSEVVNLVKLALQEDRVCEDITTKLIFDASLEATAKVEARQELLFCGGGVTDTIFRQLNWPYRIKYLRADGSTVQSGETLVEIEADARHLLAAERTILNFLQRLCGIATYTQSFMQQANGIKVLDTRKTTPGWRVLEKYAVNVGGASNHRAHLADMILVKNNHIDLFMKQQGIAKRSKQDLVCMFKKIADRKSKEMLYEVEVRDRLELIAALEAGVDWIMLDNMTNSEITEALGQIDTASTKPNVEISGGITRERMQQFSKLGVECVSVGALTRLATSVDISMRIE